MEVDSNYYRPTEVDLLIGDPTKANKELGWTPKYTLDQLITEMMESDLAYFKKQLHLTNSGFSINRERE